MRILAMQGLKLCELSGVTRSRIRPYEVADMNMGQSVGVRGVYQRHSSRVNHTVSCTVQDVRGRAAPSRISGYSDCMEGAASQATKLISRTVETIPNSDFPLTKFSRNNNKRKKLGT